MRASPLPMALAATVAGLAASLAIAIGGAPCATAGDPPRTAARGRSAEYRQAIVEIEAIRKKKPPSVSTGTYADGGLESAAEMPAKGFGYRFADGKRKTHFGSDAMVFGLMEVAALLQERHPKSPWLSIGDIASEKGGRLKPHINHQDGCDVDLAFLYCNERGEPMDRAWLKCDAEGKAKGARFDAARNFELLELYVTSPYTGGCEWILCFDPGKKLIVEYGRAQAKANPRQVDRITKITDQLEKLLRQPDSSAHDDHFHIRVNRAGPPGGIPEATGLGGEKGAKPARPKKPDPKKPAEPEKPEEPEGPEKPEPEGDGEGSTPGGDDDEDDE